MNKAARLSISADLSVEAVRAAAEELGTKPDKLVVVAGSHQTPALVAVKRDLKCRCMALPREILCHETAWAAVYGNDAIWSSIE